MKKTIIIFSIACSLFLTVSAQKETSSYENWMDTIGVRAKLMEHTQFSLGEKITLIRDTIASDAVYKKDGSWKMFDVRIFFKKGLRGIFEKEETIEGRHVIWVQFKVEVKAVEDGKLRKSKENISIPFAPTGAARNNLFASTGITMLEPEIDESGAQATIHLGGTKFQYGGHSYQISNGGSDLEISKEMLSGLIMAQDIKVKN